MNRQLAWTFLAAMACQPVLPDDKPDDTDSDEPPVDSDTDPVVDTAPEPPCRAPEVEPNNELLQATVVPTDVQACGRFGTTTDADFWSFSLGEETWLGVDLDAFRVGSEANVQLTLASEEVDVGFAIDGWQDLPDVMLRFPSPPATYVAIVRQVLSPDFPAGSGDDYFYELLATAAKAPVDWDVEELANDSEDAPQVIPAGQTLFGSFSDDDDEDWFAIDIPAGRHRLVLDVDAHEFGSAADLALRWTNPNGAVVTTRDDRVGGFRDPYLAQDYADATRVVVRILEEGGQHGPAFWYTMKVTVEAQ